MDIIIKVVFEMAFSKFLAFENVYQSLEWAVGILTKVEKGILG